MIYFLSARVIFLSYHIEDTKLLTLEIVWGIFWNGIRMDFSMSGYLSVIPFLLVSISNFIKKSHFCSTTSVRININMDTSKMGLWPGGLLTIMGEGNFGKMLTRNTGSLIGVNINDFLPETENSFVIPQLTYAQFLSPEFGLVLGKFATISSSGGDMNAFAHGKGSEQFLNLAFSVNPVTALTVPYSTLGLSAVYLPSKDLVMTASVLDPHGKAEW